MKHRDKIDGVVNEMDDGDKETSDITEIHGEFREQAVAESIKFALDLLKGCGCDMLEFEKGYLITKPQAIKIG